MNEHNFYLELEDIHGKYERLTSLIAIMQMFAAEVIEVAGAPADSLSNALFEIEAEMDKTNGRLKGLFQQEGGAV